ncbi:MAG TPA: phosphate/phosphite/phosphonate ABC transporter substrate-binding protein [Spirochaetia bacterium]|nr:phosphate/phosphite/phosphonate ABC transporter substrate-binding protein [Spirochaetia bacterium]
MKRVFLALLVLLVSAGLAMAAGAKEAQKLGTEENPIIWAFVPSGDTQTIVAGGQAVSDLLFKKTGLYFKVMVATDYAGVIEALSSTPPKAHMASLATFAYVLAADRGVAQAALVAVRFGTPYYNGQIIANVKSGIKTLADLKGKTFARPDPLSTSGWIIPELTMRAAGINPEKDLKQIVDAGGHTAVVTAVYNGDVDAGATFVDARQNIQKDHPDVNDKVKVINVSVNIPNDGVQFQKTVPQDLRDKITNALLEIAQTPEGKDALKKAYSWTGLEKQGDNFYDPFRQVLQSSGMKIEDLMK